MGKHNDLPGRGSALEGAGQAGDAGRVHGLDGVVDHDEAERALGEGGARDEEAEGEGMQLALAHYAQGGARNAVNGDIQDHAPTRAISGELDPPQLHVALLAKALPDPCCFFGDWPETVVTNPRRCFLEPGLRPLEALEGSGSAHPLSRASQPIPDLTRYRAPGVLPALDLRSCGFPKAKDCIAQLSARRLHVIGEMGEVVDRSRPDPDLQRGNQLAQVQPRLARLLESLAFQNRHVLPPPPGGFGSLVSRLCLLRRLPKARQGSPLLFAPRTVKGALAATDRAVTIAMGGAECESQLEELRRVAGAPGGRAQGGGEGSRRGAHFGHGLGHSSRVGGLHACDSTKHVGLPRPFSQQACSRNDPLHRGKVPFLALDGRHHPASAFVVNLPQSLEEAIPGFGCVLEALLTGPAGLLKRALGFPRSPPTQEGGKGGAAVRGGRSAPRAPP